MASPERACARECRPAATPAPITRRKAATLAAASRRHARAMLLASASLLAVGAAQAGDNAASSPAPATVSNEALLKKLDAMERRIKMLEGQLRQKKAAAPAAASDQRAAASARVIQPRSTPTG